jgi:hypothetical protein
MTAGVHGLLESVFGTIFIEDFIGTFIQLNTVVTSNGRHLLGLSVALYYRLFPKTAAVFI